MKRIFAILILAGLPLAAASQTTPQTDLMAGIRATGRGVATGTVTSALVRVSARGVSDGNDFLAAIKSAGVEDAALDLGTAGSGSMMFVRGRLPNVTRAKIDAVTAAATEYSRTHVPVLIAEVRFYGPAADCPTIEQRAREAALTEARRRANAIASASNQRLGAQIAVREDGGCPQVGPSGGANALDISTLSMRVIVDETVTFAIVR